MSDELQCTSTSSLRWQTCTAEQSSSHTPSIALRMHARAHSCPDVNAPATLRSASGSGRLCETTDLRYAKSRWWSPCRSNAGQMLVELDGSRKANGPYVTKVVAARLRIATCGTTFFQASMSAALPSSQMPYCLAAENIDLHGQHTKQYLPDFGAALQLQPGCGRGWVDRLKPQRPQSRTRADAAGLDGLH